MQARRMRSVSELTELSTKYFLLFNGEIFLLGKHTYTSLRNYRTVISKFFDAQSQGDDEFKIEV